MDEQDRLEYAKTRLECVSSSWSKDLGMYIEELEEASDRLGKSLMEVARFRDYLVSKGQSPDSNVVVWLDKLLGMLCKKKEPDKKIRS